MGEYAVMLKCRKCKVGTIRIVSDIIDHYAIVHCQNQECAVLYELRLKGAFHSGGTPDALVRPKKNVSKTEQPGGRPHRRGSREP
jgi:hypothetical protein